MLAIIWLAAIQHMRGPGRHRRDRLERWRDIHELTSELGHPAFPRGLGASP